MTPHHPIITTDLAPARLVGEVAMRRPSAGSLGWVARLELIALISAFLWSIVIGLVRLIA